VHKGSIAIEGISLTVADLKGRDSGALFRTPSKHNLQSLRPGDPINWKSTSLKIRREMMRSKLQRTLLWTLVREGFRVSPGVVA